MVDIALSAPPVISEPPEFRLSDYLDLSRPVDYYLLHDAHLRACTAFVGPEFRAAVEALGEKQAAFWERTFTANFSAISRGEIKAPAGYLMDGATVEQEQPKQAIPFWWTKENR